MLTVTVIKSTWRRPAAATRTAVFLMIGGLLAVPYAALVTWIVQLWRFAGDNPLAVPSGLMIGAGLLAVPATLKVIRTLERTAANELLGTALAEPTGPVRLGDVARGSAWFLLHLASGALAAAVLVLVIPVLAAFAISPFTGGMAVAGPLASQFLPDADPAVAVYVLLAACAGALALLIGIASQLGTWAVLLLGPSELEKLAIVERRSLELARRNELARELHDSIGHALTVTTLQAAAAHRLVATDPARAAEAMAAVENAGRAALEELDQLLSVLRAPADPEVFRASAGAVDGYFHPQPVLAPGPIQRPLTELRELADQHCSAGLLAGLHVTGDTEAVPALLAREAYRIIQEGLTNALKHGGGSTCEVAVSVTGGRDSGMLRIGISNPLSSKQIKQTQQTKQNKQGGRGLAGLRERTLLLGGTFQAGASDGVWQLSAELPWKGQGHDHAADRG
jgi:signal transduction histidine kinase